MKYILLLAVCCIVIPINGQESSSHSSHHQQPADSSRHPQNQADTVNVGTVNVNKLNVPQQAETSGETNNNDKKPQSYFCRLIAPETLPNTILCVIGILGIFAAGFTLKAMKKQSGLMQWQLELSQRPWISVTRLPQALQFNTSGAILGCVYKLENVGGSVAWNISIWADLVPEGKDWRPTLDRLQGVMKDAKNEKSDYGYVLFPKESTKQAQPAILRRQDLDDSIKNDIFKGNGKVGFKLVGCIDYRSHVSPKHYQTTFVDLVGYVDNTRGGLIMGAFDPNVQNYIPTILTPHGHGASAT